MVNTFTNSRCVIFPRKRHSRQFVRTCELPTIHAFTKLNTANNLLTDSVFYLISNLFNHLHHTTLHYTTPQVQFKMRGLRGLSSLPLPAQLKALPLPVVRIIGLLIVVNALVWVAAGVVLRYFPAMISPAVLSYTLGLRHALDADHISAIDLMTRRLIAAGQRPVTVGTFFSLGHSTIVIITCIVVAATSGALRDRFDNFAYVGGIIGTSVSAAFLILLCFGNGWVLYRLITCLREVLLEPDPHNSEDEDIADEDQAANNLRLEGPGFLASVFRGLFRVVDRPWKMYPLGVLFGLGFDTSSEIAILGIASIHGAQGTSL